MKQKNCLVLGLLVCILFSNCEGKDKSGNSNVRIDTTKNGTKMNKDTSKVSKNEIKERDTFSALGNWYAQNFFFYSKIGTIGINESKGMIAKCLYIIDNNKLISHISETGYKVVGDTIYYDTIRVSMAIKNDLVNEYSNSFRYFQVETFNKKIRSDKIKLIEFGRKKDLDKDNKDMGWYATFMIDDKNVWVDNGGGAIFQIGKK